MYKSQSAFHLQSPSSSSGFYPYFPGFCRCPSHLLTFSLTHSQFYHYNNESTNQSASTRSLTHPEHNKTEQNTTTPTHSLIHTPNRRHIPITPQIHPQTLPLTYQPRTRIWPRGPRNSPLQRIATPREHPIGIFLFLELNRQLSRPRHSAGYHISIQEGGRGDKLDKLSVDDGELPGCEVGGQDGGPGNVGGGCLEVLVEIGGGDGADPVVACLEGCAGTGGCACG